MLVRVCSDLCCCGVCRRGVCTYLSGGARFVFEEDKDSDIRKNHDSQYVKQKRGVAYASDRGPTLLKGREAHCARCVISVKSISSHHGA